MPDYDAPLKRVLEVMDGPTKLADALGIRAPSVIGWKRVPAERVPVIAALTGIPERELRPDMYPEAALPTPEAESGTVDSLAGVGP